MTELRCVRSLLATVGTAVAAGAGAALLAARAFADSLPYRLATHWGSTGAADRSTELGTLPVWMMTPWLITCAIALAVGLRGWNRPAIRGTVGMILGGGAGLCGTIGYSVVAVNIGVQDWRRVPLPGWHVALAIGATIVLAAAGWWLGRHSQGKSPTA